MRLSACAIPIFLAGTLAAATLSSTQPATAPAIDRSAPEKTWATACATLKAGDLAALRGCFYNGNELSQMFMDLYTDLNIASYELSTVTAKLGDDGVKMSKNLGKAYEDMVKTGENREVKIRGDEAVWTRREVAGNTATEEVFYFKRVKNEWLIDTLKTYHLDTDEGRDAAEKFIVETPRVVTLVKQVTRDIRENKITTIDQMRKRMQASATRPAPRKDPAQ